MFPLKARRPINRHQARSVKGAILRGRMAWVFYDDCGNKVERVVLDAIGNLRMLNEENDR